jgi:hypothetical protein
LSGWVGEHPGAPATRIGFKPVLIAGMLLISWEAAGCAINAAAARDG